jgi:S-methylmethionine-dependent homocysteine/selenocysteine methylase/SAM-dependent methyltransferase
VAPDADTALSGALRSPAYKHLEDLLSADRCVILDGGVATELQRLALDSGTSDAELWGTWALYRAPQSVAEVHRRYVDIGCDVISTDTWSILSTPEAELRPRYANPELSHWMDVARLGIRLARHAVEEAEREGECAVAFAISEEVNSLHRKETIELLGRVFEDEPPDLILLETLTLIRDPATFEAVELLLETGLPLWLSFRRCRHGVCGVYGQHWGPPEGDLFGRAARRFEEMGVGALLINCLPVEHVPGMISWLRDFTDIPLGVYPNLGYLGGSQWRFDESIGPDEYAELALAWRSEGAQIIGGCCGVTPDHVSAAVKVLAGTKPGRQRPPLSPEVLGNGGLAIEPDVRPWLDGQGRPVYPLPFPELTIDSGVFVPTQGSFLVWKHLFETGAGGGKSCLDVGCGCGILAVQLALNGASSVHAIDIDRNAIANTLANAFRNGVSDRVTGEDIDLYHWDPARAYDTIVASLYQMPVDPFEEPTGHRPLDYWGRNLLDHFLRLLPRLLNEGGTAYVMQLSIIDQVETSRILAQDGFTAKVVDFSFFPFGPIFMQNRDQILRVEQLSDAHHLLIGNQDVMVAYLLEITRSG